MKWCEMARFVALCLLIPVGSGRPAEPSHGSLMTAPYRPQAGDLVLFDDFNPLHRIAFRLARTAPPVHAAVVVERPDGSHALLDLFGPRVISGTVRIAEIGPRLGNYVGAILVRRLRAPLPQDRKEAMWRFAEAQEGKGWAAGRVLLLGGPFNARYGLRRALFGRTVLERSRWICSEVVVAAGTVAGLFDPRTLPANAVTPRDLAFDETYDLSALYCPALPWSASPCH